MCGNLLIARLNCSLDQNDNLAVKPDNYTDSHLNADNFNCLFNMCMQYIVIIIIFFKIYESFSA